MLPVIIGWLLTVGALILAVLSGGYYAKVRFMRHLFKSKGTPTAESVIKTHVIKDVDYLSVFQNGTLDIYTAKNATAPQPVLLWIHGGGYIGGDKSYIKAWAHAIAAELNIAVASINYALAPIQHYPVPLVQVGEALKFLAENASRFNLDASRIFLGGDSAGAQIASQYAAVVCNSEYATVVKIKPPITKNELRGVVLCCGFYNLNTVSKTRFPAIKTFIRAYTNAENIKKCPYKDELSAVKQISGGYCDTFITCGNRDPFITQSLEFAAKLTENGVCADAYFPRKKGVGLGHEYQFLLGKPYADTALKRAVKFIENRL